MTKPVAALEVAVFTALRQPLTYLCNGAINTKSGLGYRVLVPLGARRQVVGVVVNEIASAKIEAKVKNKLKPILKFLDTAPVLSPVQLKLASWLSSFYLYPLGQTIEQMLPAKLRQAKTQLDLTNMAAENKVGSIEINLPKWQLSESQSAVLREVDANSGFQPYLLFGSTNSGKTEIYLRLAANALNKGLQVLVLVPEIGLTPQTIKRFTGRFSNVSAVIFHSRLTPKARLEAWLNCYTNKAQLVIGTRSALFLPLSRLGLIVIDEEHDSSFKQESKLRYHASEAALMLAKYLAIPVLLGSATPSATSWYNAVQGRYQLLTLPPRTSANNNVTINLVDTAGAKLIKGFSGEILSAMEACLSKHQQVVVFLNRRGYAAKLCCQQCNWQARCPHCDAPLTVHRLLHKLVCHHCQFQRPLPSECPSCRSAKLTTQGVGTERLEESLKEIFPNFPLARLDRDSAQSMQQLETMLKDVAANRYQILVGTQILAKGHHFPNIALVVVMNVDGALFGEDFHQEEQLAQLLVQVMGRAGRGEHPGRVMIQTAYPNHPFFEELKKQDYKIFLTRCLKERQEAQLPPFSCQAILQAESKLRPKAHQFLNAVLALARELDISTPFKVFGPAPLKMERKTDQFRARLVLQAPNYLNLHKVLINLNHQIVTQLKAVSNLKWFWELNPLNLLDG